MELTVSKLTECMHLFMQQIFLEFPFCQSLCFRQMVGSPSDGPLAIREFTVWGRRWTGAHKWHKYMLSDRSVRQCPGRRYVTAGHVTWWGNF